MEYLKTALDMHKFQVVAMERQTRHAYILLFTVTILFILFIIVLTFNFYLL